MKILVKRGIRMDTEKNPAILTFYYPQPNDGPKCLRRMSLGIGKPGKTRQVMRAAHSLSGRLQLPRVHFTGMSTKWNIYDPVRSEYPQRQIRPPVGPITGAFKGILQWMDFVNQIEDTFGVKVTKVCPNVQIQDGSSEYVVRADLMLKLLAACKGKKRQKRVGVYESNDGFPSMDANDVSPLDDDAIKIPVLNKGEKEVSSIVYTRTWKRIISGVEKLLKVKVVAYSPNLVIRDGYSLHFLHSQLALKLLEINHV